MRWWITGLALALVSCAGSPSGDGGGSGPRSERSRAPGRASARGRTSTLVELDVSLPDGYARLYGEPVRHALSPIEKAISVGVGQLGPAHDPALSKMARELAADAPDRLNVPGGLIAGLMAWAGLPDPSPGLVTIEIPQDGGDCSQRVAPACREFVDGLVDQVRGSVEGRPDLSYGVGVVGLDTGATRMIVALLERAVTMKPVAVAIPAGDTVVVEGQLLGDRHGPSLELVDPKGRWSQVPALTGDDGSFSARVACGRGRGVYQLEVLAEGAHGPEVAANFPLHCGVQPPRTLRVTVETVGPGVSAEAVARANFEYLNEARRVRGLPVLQWDASAARAAVDHSRDMRDHDYVGHVSPRTGNVRDRLLARGVKAVLMLENVARGYGPRAVHDSLMHSPGHRVNMVSPEVTHVGIGVVFGPPESSRADAPRPVFVTQNFFKAPGAGAPVAREQPGAIRARVDEARRKADLPRLPWDPRLSAVAQKEAEARARGRAGAGDALRGQVFSLGFSAVALHQASSPDFDALASLDVFSAPPARAVGIGVAQAKKRGSDPGQFWIVVLVAER